LFFLANIKFFPLSTKAGFFPLTFFSLFVILSISFRLYSLSYFF
jgi:hypothetical protein